MYTVRKVPININLRHTPPTNVHTQTLKGEWRERKKDRERERGGGRGGRHTPFSSPVLISGPLVSRAMHTDLPHFLAASRTFFTVWAWYYKKKTDTIRKKKSMRPVLQDLNKISAGLSHIMYKEKHMYACICKWIYAAFCVAIKDRNMETVACKHDRNVSNSFNVVHLGTAILDTFYRYYYYVGILWTKWEQFHSPKAHCGAI